MPSERQISFRVDDKTYKKIKEKQKESKMSMKAYLVHCALNNNPVHIHYNYDAIQAHTKLVLDVKDHYYPVIAMATATGQIFPSDIQILVSCLNKIESSLMDLIDENYKERVRLRKHVKKELKSHHDL